MGFDVFISYAHEDKPIADAACAIIEKSGIRCWIAPRDIAPGAEYAAALGEALENCKALVLIFSGRANESPHIRREVERAVSRGIPLIPVRIEDIEPTASLKYFVGAVHWLDALTPPLEQHFANLATTLQVILKRNETPPGSISPEMPQQGQTATTIKPPDAAFARHLFRARLVTIAGWVMGGLLSLILVLLHDTADLLLSIGGLAISYVFVYRNLPADLVTARLVTIIGTGIVGYFVLINAMAGRGLFVLIEGIDFALSLYLIYEINALMKARK